MSRKSRRLLLGALVSFAGYLALAVLATQQYFAAIDFGTRSWVALLKYEALDLPVTIVTQLGDKGGLVPLLMLAIAVLWRVHRPWAVALPVLMIGAWALQLVTKWSMNLPRPNADPWGFPSGHVLSLVVFFGLVVWLIATASKRRRRWRVLACVVCVGTVGAVAFSRLYLDKHWLSDLAGGLTIGLAYLLLAIWIVEVAWAARPWRARYSPGTEGDHHDHHRTATVPDGDGVGVGAGRHAADREGADESQTR